MCPLIDLVEVTLICGVCAPKTLQIASDSRLSPSGVDVPWALMVSIWSGSIPARATAICIARADPAPLGAGMIWS
jgi:hypothetical protein